MFPKTIYALTLLATALSAAGLADLTVTVSGAPEVDGVDNFDVVTTITNSGSETVKVLEHPNGPLSKLPTEIFDLTSESGTHAAFNGIKAKFVPSAAVAAGAFVELVPGQSIQVTHNIGKAYNLTLSGAGAYEVKPFTELQIVNDAGEISSIRARLPRTHRVRVKGRLSTKNLLPWTPTPSLSRRATFVSCSAARQTALNSAISAAQTMSSSAKNYLAANTGATTRYTTWFGALTSSRRSTVVSHFTKITDAGFSGFTYDCSCTTAGTYAYVYPNTFGKIYLCGAFWNAPLTGTDSKAGTLIHESSHFTRNGGTDDHVYGQSGAKNLAKNTPDKAVMNADNHEYFAENNPVLA